MKKLLTLMLSAIVCLQFTACALPTGGNTIQDKSAGFVNAAMEASYYGKVDNYAEYASEDSGKELYDSEVTYFAYYMMNLCEIAEECQTEDVIERLTNVGKTVMGKVKWEISEITVDKQTGMGQVELALYPTDFLDLISDDYNTAVTTFNDEWTKVQEAAQSGATDSEERLNSLEKQYTEDIVKIAEQYAEAAQPVSTAITKLYKVDYNGNDGIISDTDWDEVDDIMMGFDE